MIIIINIMNLLVGVLFLNIWVTFQTVFSILYYQLFSIPYYKLGGAPMVVPAGSYLSGPNMLLNFKAEIGDQVANFINSNYCIYVSDPQVCPLRLSTFPKDHCH